MDALVKKRLDSFVSSKGLRKTHQRSEIVAEIFSKEDHFTVEELLERLRQKGVRFSRATVYRTIALLQEANMLHEIDLGDEVNTYDPNFLDRPTHNHLLCVDCGKVTEFEDSHLETLNDCLSRRMGFRPVKQSLRIEACCEKLRATGACSSLIDARINGRRMPNKKR